MIKGLEAMVIESFTAARAYGVEDAVLASLSETFPGIDWEKQAAYFFQRVDRARPAPQRGGARGRRAPCARPASTPWSASGTAERQAWVADLRRRRRVRRAAARRRLRAQRRLARRGRPHPATQRRRPARKIETQ